MQLTKSKEIIDKVNWQAICKDGVYNRKDMPISELKDVSIFTLLYNGEILRSINTSGASPIFFITTCGKLFKDEVEELFIEFGYMKDGGRFISRYDLINNCWME